MKKLYFLLAPLFTFITSATAALADKPTPWQLGFQEPASPVAERLFSFHDDLLLIVCIVVTLFVVGLLTYVIINFNEKANPKPSKITHNTLLEIVWTTVPVLILIVIAIPSFKNLYYMDKTHEADMTLKVTGYQWYWGYEYPDYGKISFESYMIQDDDLKEGQIRLLETDNRIVLPVDTNVRVLLTSSDVIHAWAIPSLGVKIDTVPGRLNETWLRINKPGVYRGQCSELCGPYHAFMPIVIEAVSKKKFKSWVRKAKKKFANDNTQTPSTKIALITN
jgi:cytochrome c oxidase subunit 2